MLPSTATEGTECDESDYFESTVSYVQTSEELDPCGLS